MFTSKGLFWDIVCPYNQDCKLPGCIFSHPNGRVFEGLSTSQVNVVSAGDEGPRKRRKLDNDEDLKALASHADQTVKPDQERSELSATPSGNSNEKVFVNPPVSPPPLRRKSLPIVQSGTVRTPTRPIPNIAVPKSAPKVLAKPAKVEVLHPRKLKCPEPGKYDFRIRLIKALFEQLNRLNSELSKDANDEEEKLVLSEQELITRVLDIEENAAFTPSIYQNTVKNSIMIYKRMSVAQWKEVRTKEIKQAKEAASLLVGALKPSQEPKVIDTEMSTNEELKLLHRLHTDISGLSKHGYVVTVPTEGDIESARKGVEAAKGWEVCDRCKSRFQVFPGRREEDGVLATGGKCTYHFGKPYLADRPTSDPRGKKEKKFRCCNQSMGDSTGCTTSESHVFKISEVKRLATVLNFETTPKNMAKVSNRPVCIDGEMGYTVYGLELIRLTATSWPDGNELFDVLVRPVGEILDLNSRYSGVWPADVADAIPWNSTEATPPPEEGTKRKLRIVSSPAAARALLFSHLSPLTPLIGHGLENDLNATRLIHPTIIDTALLYPHKAGLPYRNGLKMLMLTHLNRHIQVVVNGKMEGHDSKEDANAAGQLVRFALANEWQKMKKEGWTLEHGEFWPPMPKEQSYDAPKDPSGMKRLRGHTEIDASSLVDI